METHIYDEILDKLDIPGYVRLGYKNRKKFKKANKSSGGIALFAKSGIAKLLQPFETKNEDIIWFKLKDGPPQNPPNDIYLGTAYISSENGTRSILAKLRNMSEGIVNIQSKGGTIIMQGDLNARTANLKDYIEYYKNDTNIQYTPDNSNLQGTDENGSS